MQQFSQRARQTLTAAQATARQMQHASIEPAHLLLALLELPDSAAHKILSGMRLKPEPIRDYLASLPGAPADSASLALSPNIKRVLEFAVDESRRRRHAYVGTEHILLALARHNHPTIRDLLATAHIDCDRIRQRVMSMFDAGLTPEAPAAPRRSRSQPPDLMDEAVQHVTGQVMATLTPDDWKTLSRIAKHITVVMRDAVGPYNMLLLGKPRDALYRVLEALLRRAAIAPDDYLDT